MIALSAAQRTGEIISEGSETVTVARVMVGRGIAKKVNKRYILRSVDRIKCRVALLDYY